MKITLSSCMELSWRLRSKICTPTYKTNMSRLLKYYTALFQVLYVCIFMMYYFYYDMYLHIRPTQAIVGVCKITHMLAKCPAPRLQLPLESIMSFRSLILTTVWHLSCLWWWDGRLICLLASWYMFTGRRWT